MLVGEGDGGGIIRANKAAKQRTSQSKSRHWISLWTPEDISSCVCGDKTQSFFERLEDILSHLCTKSWCFSWEVGVFASMIV